MGTSILFFPAAVMFCLVAGPLPMLASESTASPPAPVLAGLSLSASTGLQGLWNSDTVFGTGFLPYTHNELALQALFALSQDFALGFRAGLAANTSIYQEGYLYLPKSYSSFALALAAKTGQLGFFAGAAWGEYTGTGIVFFYPDFGVKLSFPLGQAAPAANGQPEPGPAAGLAQPAAVRSPRWGLFLLARLGLIHQPGPSASLNFGVEGWLPW